MDASTYKESIDLYKNKLLNHLNSVSLISPPNFNSFPIDCRQIDSFKEKKYKALVEKGVLDGDTPYIYYFKLASKCDKKALINEIQIFKSSEDNSKALKLPLVHGHFDSDILYVGKSQGDFLTRTKVHFGFTGDKTYGLHLKKWFDIIGISPDLTLQFYYAPIEVKDENLVELIESSLHLKLKPILGRSGH